MSHMERISSVGSKIITVLISVSIFTPIFFFIQRNNINFIISAMLLIAGLLLSLLLNYILGSIWVATLLVINVIKSESRDVDDDEDYTNF